MVSIKALIASTLFASALAFPFGPKTVQCTIRSENNVVTIDKFDGKTVKLPKYREDLRMIVSNKLPHKETFQLLANFDKNTPNLIHDFHLIHFAAGDSQAHVSAFMVGSPELFVETVEFDGSSSKTTTTGDFSVLNGFVKYSVNETQDATIINFVVNDDTYIDVSVGKNATIGTIIKLNEPYKYRQGASDCQFQTFVYGV